ncbi:hypothetical protein [Granulicella mallensis]|uniref:AsmA-like C-terminal domain-containing protein n=1 Tax=Granulicella mallensis TaxID=940614 RepID=A0A7W8EBK1_9BACT|nr:hypothetical protein [Granulicella mallensis]MBB5065659.1 hypothetical protein [Granulicella mallensis]
MNDDETQRGTEPERAAVNRSPRWWRRRWVQVTLTAVVVVLVGLVIGAAYVIHNEEPLVRGRVVAALSQRFNSPVELDKLNISLLQGIEVHGRGLRIRYIAGPTAPDHESNVPMLSVASFTFRTNFTELLHQPMRVEHVSVEGMELHIPPANQRGPLIHHDDPGATPTKVTFLVDRISCKDVKLFIETSKPGKDPLEFDIQKLILTDVGATQPFAYEADLTNPKPLGQIHATGHFGPWASAEPRDSPLDGDYSFSHADLSTIKGIGGMLSSTGHFSGQLGNITADGTTDTPDFSLDVSNHPVPLHTTFHAYIDGSTGDTTLDPVQAHLLHSDFTARGKVQMIHGQGHDIALDVDMPHARIEDMLELGVKTDPPLMHGALTLKTKLHIPPGHVRVAQKVELTGNFAIHSVGFSNPKVQDRVDSMSMRAQGRPQEAGAAGSDRQAEVQSEMTAHFNLGHGVITVNDLHYKIPGALVLLNGVYSMDGNLFEFKGHVRTDATASQMVSGWKSWLLKGVDPFLKKNGAGLELPISISGTKGDVNFGLALNGTSNETPEQMKADLKAKAAARKGFPQPPKH